MFETTHHTISSILSQPDRHSGSRRELVKAILTPKMLRIRTENPVIHRQFRWGVFPANLMNGNSILRPHLVKLINADNSIVSQHHGPSLHAYRQLFQPGI
jgi:hypothetical protein